MEDIEDSDSSKDEVQLGRLHFSMDYDFTKSEVYSSPSRRYTPVHEVSL